MVKVDIEKIVNLYKSKSTPYHRYSSFDYCYNYFRTTNDLTHDIEKSCLVLGFYLASWGMYRGSSFILQKSLKQLEPTVQYIASQDRSTWDIDVDTYNEQSIQTIRKTYDEIKDRLFDQKHSDLTLITKIQLGVFGFIPAFDNYFCMTFREIYEGKYGFRKINEKSLLIIKSFYEDNKPKIDKLSLETFTTDFSTGQKTKINYPKAKIIDMYGFMLARNKPKQTFVSQDSLVKKNLI